MEHPCVEIFCHSCSEHSCCSDERFHENINNVYHWIIFQSTDNGQVLLQASLTDDWKKRFPARIFRQEGEINDGEYIIWFQDNFGKHHYIRGSIRIYQIWEKLNGRS